MIDSLEAMTGKNGKSKTGHKQNKQKSRANFKMLVQVPALRVCLPYAFSSTLTEAAVTLGAAYSFRINDVFDPDFTGGGLQPLGFDQYAAMYGRYHVLGFRYEIEFIARTSIGTLVGAYLSPQSTLPAVSTAWLVVNQTAKYESVGQATGSDTVKKISGRTNITDVLGVSPAEYRADQDFSATTSATPARPAYLHVWTRGISAVGVNDFTVRLYYDVEFSQPVSLSLS